MEQFVKLKKNITMMESTRQMLNKSIDLLHKLSKKKITADAVKKELSAYLSNHLLNVEPDKKFQLEQFIALAENIVDSVDEGKIPLYEGIMSLNKMVMPEQQGEAKKEKANFIRFAPIPEKEPGMTSREFDPTGDKIEESTMTINKPKAEEPKMEIGQLIEEVLKQKELLDRSVGNLNVTLRSIGYELKPVK